jgi:anti-anti-sigma factor
MNAMNVEYIDNKNSSFYIMITGEMDAGGCSASQIADDLENLLTPETEQHISLDIGNVTFLDSSGIGIIVFLFKRLKSSGGSLEIINANGQPKDLINLLRVDNVISVKFN